MTDPQPPAERVEEHPPPTHVLVHLSDTHLVGDPDGRLGGVADPDGHLTGLLDTLVATELRPDALVVTGDIADTGDPRAYQRVRAAVGEAAERLDARVVWSMGNHDDRDALRRHLRGEPGGTDPVDEVIMLGGLRVVNLDSTVPGHHWGRVDPAQLEWLGSVLAEPAPEGTVLAMHHPPLPCVQIHAVTVELLGQAELADVLRGTDVRAILAGHVHFSTFGTFAGIPVATATSTAYTQDLTEPDGGTRGRDAAQGFSVVRVYPDLVLHTPVLAGGGPTVGRPVTGRQAAALLTEAGIRRR